MIRVVYDTNVFASAIAVPQGTLAIVSGYWIRGEIRLITSEPLIQELARTLEKPYFSSRLTKKQIKAFKDIVYARTKIVQITTPIPKIATHLEDDLVLATAESGQAHYIVTGDHGLQSLKQFKGIAIVSPGIFCSIVQQQQD